MTLARVTQGGYTPPPTKKKKKNAKTIKQKRPINGALVFSGIVLILAVVVSCGVLFVWQDVKRYEETFLPGLYLEEYALDGMTPEQAASLLYDLTEEKRSAWSTTLRWKGKDYSLTADEIGLTVDREATLGALWQIGREESLPARVLAVARARTSEGIRKEPVIRFEEAPIRELLSRLRAEVDRPAVNATASFDPKMDAPFTFADEQTGYRLETEPLLADIREAAETLKPFDAEVHPEVLEPDFYRAELENAISLRARVRLAMDTEAALENESLALSGLNGRTIAPGEVFSFNEAVGNRSEEAGYATADEPAFGPYAGGIGGGVCRVATMLYQAALLSGLRIEERHAASYPVPYADPGMEAAVSDRGLDLRVANNTGYPLWIFARDWLEADEHAFAEIQIIGLPLTARYRLESTQETGKTPKEPVYVRDREGRYAVYSDERVQAGEALPEIVSQTRRIVSDSEGNDLSEELISQDRYEAVPARIYVGAKER